jgi:HK97 gp10 family phage protein
MPASGIEIKLFVDKASVARVDRAFRELPTAIFNRVVGRAADAAMTPMLAAAKRKCPVETGVLKKSLGRKHVSYRGRGVQMVFIGPLVGFKDPGTGRNPANYAHLVEYGTGPHVIPATPGGHRIANQIVAGAIHHPGAQPKPFMRPAFDENARRVVSLYRDELLQGIERETAKLNASG